MTYADVRATVAEFAGTFYLVAIIATIVTRPAPKDAPADALLPAVGIGCGLAALIYTLGPVSKAHFNPAVTATFLVAGDVSSAVAGAFVGVQLLAGYLAALLAAFINDVPAGPAPATAEYGVARAFAAEMLFTSMLVLIIMRIAMTRAGRGNQFAGTAIACVVTAGICAVGPRSGAVFNPAVGTGLVLAQCSLGPCEAAKYLWVYWGGALLGAAVGYGIFRAVSDEPAEPAAPDAEAAPRSVDDCCGPESESICINLPGSNEPTTEGQSCIKLRTCQR